MSQMHLSDVFKFTQGLGQKGHQIGRKVGDAIELITLAMISKEESLTSFLVIEDGVEGATTAKHKVEFAFYNLDLENVHQRNSENLFGIIECKKVGVEQTIKQNFKKWQSLQENKKEFYLTDGYSFTISPSNAGFKWTLKLTAVENDENNISVSLEKASNGVVIESDSFSFICDQRHQILIVQDVNDSLFILGPNETLNDIVASIKKCIVVQIKAVTSRKIITIHVNESLPGPQTPEKAKQASFVSLDVRKKVLGRFDKTDDDSFISILVIGEASHWERKSRSMVRLCNDYNLIIPDAVLVKLFQVFDQEFGENYQEIITKTNYRKSKKVQNIVNDVINTFNGRVLLEMGSNQFVEFEHFAEDNKNKLRLRAMS
ncbi:MAG: hypothetical protein Q8J88_03605 [Bacteroidales bacterium]|nr:hypothetical protein [Bacteroidales bacterium]